MVDDGKKTPLDAYSREGSIEKKSGKKLPIDKHFTDTELGVSLAQLHVLRTIDSSNSIPTDNNETDTLVSFTFQFGASSSTTMVDLSEIDFSTFKAMAFQYVQRRVPDHIVTAGLCERIMLFLHDYDHPTMLTHLVSLTQLINNSIVEIVISANKETEKTIIQTHSLAESTVIAPKSCDVCGLMCWTNTHILKCHACGGRYHKKCATKIPTACPETKIKKNSRKTSRTVTPVQTPEKEQNPITNKKLRKTTPNPEDVHPVPNGHNFQYQSFEEPNGVACEICKKVLNGHVQYGQQCDVCGMTIHTACIGETLTLKCPGPRSREEKEKQENGPQPEKSQILVNGNACYFVKGSGSGRKTEERRETRNQTDNYEHHRTKTRRERGPRRILKEGWMVHYTNRDSMSKCHYWVLDTKKLVLYHNEIGNSRYKTIRLSEILGVKRSPQYNGEEEIESCFVLLTIKGDLFVGQCPMGDRRDSDGLSDESELRVSGDSSSRRQAIGRDAGETWYLAIQDALTPVPGDENSQMIRLSTILPEASEECPGTRISQVYQIYIDKVLGSGSFGTVFKGVHRHTNREVAMKSIVKSSNSAINEKQLKNEMSIMKDLNHPNIVTMEAVQETSTKILFVMELVKGGDMLQMILQSQRGRLPERITKFIIIQILRALEYLHNRDIVHCDLKPENILLSSNSDFPQVKLCDFGYSKIITAESFRTSLVGTIPYLAPEVLIFDPYNRSVDIWAVGVITYVALSGQFPFELEPSQNLAASPRERIMRLLQDKQQLFPRSPWRGISKEATDFIRKSFTVEKENRMSAEECLNQPWFKDRQLKKDLHRLEKSVEVSYMSSSMLQDLKKEYGDDMFAQTPVNKQRREAEQRREKIRKLRQQQLLKETQEKPNDEKERLRVERRHETDEERTQRRRKTTLSIDLES